MGYQAFTEIEKLRKGSWLEEEDELLTASVTLLGEGKWDSIARASGLKRSGKSCRMRWMNYLRPNLKHGTISTEEEEIILRLHERWGNKWSRIARRLPGRTDNEIKNYWRTHLRKKAQEDLQIHCKTNYIAEKDCWFGQNGDKSGQKCYDEEQTLVKDVQENTENSLNVMGLSNFAITNSPYENRISDWIKVLNDQSSENYGNCFSNSAWISEYITENSIWDCSLQLWDVV